MKKTNVNCEKTRCIKKHDIANQAGSYACLVKGIHHRFPWGVVLKQINYLNLKLLILFLSVYRVVNDRLNDPWRCGRFTLIFTFN